jgi:hypothetical protein
MLAAEIPGYRFTFFSIVVVLMDYDAIWTDVSPECWYLRTSPYGVTTQRGINIFTAVRASNLTFCPVVCNILTCVVL